MGTALGLVIALLQPLGDALVVPAAPSEPGALSEVVWPALRRAETQGGWTPRAIDRAPQDPPRAAQVEGAAGALWAVTRDGTIYLRLFRVADERVLEVEVGRADAPPAALAEATRLQIDYLLRAPRQGGHAWRPQRLPPPPAPPLDPSLAAELRPPPVRLPPRRSRPNVPTLAAPVSARAAPDDETTVTVEQGATPAGAVAPSGLGVWLALGVRGATESLAPVAGLGLGLPFSPVLAARVELDYARAAVGDSTGHALAAELGIERTVWGGAAPGSVLGGVRYERLAADDEVAQRAALFAGLSVRLRPQRAFTLDLDLVVAGSPWTLALGAGDPFGHADALLRLRVGYRDK